MIFFRRVSGESMLPTLKPDTIVLAYHTRSVKPGDVVVAFVDGHEVIKRVKRVDRSNGLFCLESDNKEKGATYNNVTDRHLEGKVIWPNTDKK